MDRIQLALHCMPCSCTCPVLVHRCADTKYRLNQIEGGMRQGGMGGGGGGATGSVELYFT